MRGKRGFGGFSSFGRGREGSEEIKNSEDFENRVRWVTRVGFLDLATPFLLTVILKFGFHEAIQAFKFYHCANVQIP